MTPPSLKELAKKVAERHVEFCRLFHQSSAITQRLRSNRFSEFVSMDPFPDLPFGELEPLPGEERLSFSPGINGGAEAAFYAFIRSLVQIVEQQFHGDYVLAKGRQSSPNLLVFRRLSCNHLALWGVELATRDGGKSAIIKQSYSAYLLPHKE